MNFMLCGLRGHKLLNVAKKKWFVQVLQQVQFASMPNFEHHLYLVQLLRFHFNVLTDGFSQCRTCSFNHKRDPLFFSKAQILD